MVLDEAEMYCIVGGLLALFVLFLHTQRLKHHSLPGARRGSSICASARKADVQDKVSAKNTSTTSSTDDDPYQVFDQTAFDQTFTASNVKKLKAKPKASTRMCQEVCQDTNHKTSATIGMRIPVAGMAMDNSTKKKYNLSDLNNVPITTALENYIQNDTDDVTVQEASTL